MFLIGAIITVAMLVPFTMAGVRFAQKSMEQKPDGYAWPSLADMQLTAISAVVFAAIEIACRQVFGALFRPICKEQKDLKMQELRSSKGAFCVYKAFYFMTVTSWGYYVLKDQYYLPVSLGGKGVFIDSLKEFPFAKHAPQLKEYLLVTQGYHVGGLFTHFFTARKNDFVEMALHHIVAFYLFSGCYLCNCWEVGAVIAFLHDIADITTNTVKALAESKFKTATAIVFVTHMCIWFYTRNCLLPWMIYQILIAKGENVDFAGEPIIRPFFAYLLGCMFLLHCYWFNMFIITLNKYISSGSTEDTQNRTQVVQEK